MSTWKIHDSRLNSLVGGKAGKEMHELLIETFGKEDTKLPYALRNSKPFVLVRDFGAMPWARYSANQERKELYRFQLGPRTWSKPIYIHDRYVVSDRLPGYEQDAERLAMSLKMAGWERLVDQIIAPKAQGIMSKLSSPPKQDELPDLQVVLCWQADGRYLVIHDRSSAIAIALTWDANNLLVLGEASIQRLEALGRSTFETVIVPSEEGLREHRPAEKAGQMDEFSGAIQWRYGTKLDRTLDTLLLEACDRMEEINGELGIAYAGHRFNDAGGDDNWLAVKCGNFAWENGSYFRSSAQSLRSAPADVHALLGLLVHLQTGGLSSAFNACYGYPVGGLDVIGLFRQDGQYYFACSNSQASCGPVYSIDVSTGQTDLFGFSDRYDWNFNTGSRAGGIVPRERVLEIVTVEEVVRRVKTGETPYEAGPPHDMDVPWMWYLPSDPNA